jgi:zinc protease
VLEIIELIKMEGIDPDRLQRAKTQTKTSRAFDQQTSENVAESRAIDWMSTGDPHFSDRYVERMEQVTVEQIKDVARRYLDPSRLLTTAMLPEEAVAEAGGLAKAEELLRTATPTTPLAAQEKGPAEVVRVDLKDGTTLLLKRVDQAPVVVMSMYSLGGVTAEDAKTNGLGMLAMRLATRGTKGRSAQQIAEFFDSVGGELVTTSGNNTWNWTAQCLKEDFGKTLEVFTDVVRNPVFPEDETELMKRRIIAAIQSQDADWMSASMRFFRKTYFGEKNSPYQFLAIGEMETVQDFTPQQVRQWYTDKVLKAPRVLAVYGDIDVEKARAEVARHFGGEGNSTSRSRTRGPNPVGREGASGKPSVTVREVKINRTENPETGVVIGFDAPVVVGSEVLYPLTVADTLASGYNYPTGYIFETLRGRGLVYDAQAYVFPGRSTQTPGALIAYAGCDAKDVNEVVDAMLENIARLQGKPEEINVDWFGRTRNLIVTSEALDNETAGQQSQAAALDELFGLGYDYHDRFAGKIEAVKLEDVQAVARRLLRECVVTVTTNDPDAVQIKPGPRTYDSFPPVDLTPKGVVHDSK